MKLGSIEKDRQPSVEIMRLFEKTRVAYLSARHDPKEYGSRWRATVKLIKESYNELDAAGKEMKNFIDEDDLENNSVNDAKTTEAKNLFEKIKLLRYNSKLVEDPFAKRFKGNVLEELMTNPESMVKFVHYALRNHNNALTAETLSIKDMEPDSITEGLMGLDLEEDDIALYIIEHYGDGKDSKKVESKVKAALDLLQLVFFSQHEEKEWEELIDIDMKKSEEEKSISDFIIPNKPMYRIFDIEDINELKGFSGDWVVQEKYDGMRVQLHKFDKSVKVYSYNKKNITDKCSDIVDELKKKHFGDCILDAELILFSGEDSLHRADTIAHVFKGKYKDAKLKCHVFDIMRHEEQTLLDEELSNRITTLFNNYSSHSSEYLVFPSKRDTRMADSLKDIEEYSKTIMNMPTAEGVVIKDATSTYYLGTRKNPKWIKWKKFVDLDVIVLDKKKTKSNLYSYTVGVDIGPTDEESKFIEEIDGKKYMNVGKTLNTKTSANVGDIVRVKVDEVKQAGERFTLYSAKVIEIPEVEMPDKVVTLEFLAQDTKKSLNYDVTALTKGFKITDHIHGEAILKFDVSGFTFFEEHNLMSKNAMLDIDIWKEQVQEIMKTKQGILANAIIRYLTDNGPRTLKEVHDYLVKENVAEYKDIVKDGKDGLVEWADNRDGIDYNPQTKKLFMSYDKVQKETEEIKKEYKTPKEKRSGPFKIYAREDDNITLSIKLGEDTINWTIDLENEEELFDLFGAAGKYPAQVATNIEKEKVIDSGTVELGVQRDGYHEYFLDGNKFETKLHIRYLPVKGKKMWLAWTGYEQEPVDSKTDDGIWNIYEDKYAKTKIPQ
tara:strand:+ start:1449 stop:3947 length:2499 start_codon:yes stop_codon:yes gene_type:complete